VRDGPTRLISAMLALLVVWVVVFWAWPGATDPAITFADAPPNLIDRAAPPQPEQQRRPPPEAILREPPPPLPAQPRDRIAVLAPQTTPYVVRAGDTMQRIAAGAYGESRLWTVISRANPEVDPLKLRPGMTLRIPVDPLNVQGLPAEPGPGAEPSPEPRISPAGATIEYVVQRGDTLGAIARTYYNSASLWQVILDANRDQLRRPEDLRPGMRLVIPPPPTGAGR